MWRALMELCWLWNYTFYDCKNVYTLFHDTSLKKINTRFFSEISYIFVAFQNRL
jgi:hypothetical protein